MVQIAYRPCSPAAHSGVDATYVVPAKFDFAQDFCETTDWAGGDGADEDHQYVQFALLDEQWRVLATNRQWREAASLSEGQGLRQGQCYKSHWQSQPPTNMDSAMRILRGMQALEGGSVTRFKCGFRTSPLRERANILIAAVDGMGARYAIAIGPPNISLSLDGLKVPSDELRPATASSRERQTREDERRRIARDLHDSAAQHLTGLNLGLAHLRQISEDPDVRFVVEGLSNCLSRFQRDLRGLSYLLHPPELQEFGLNGSVSALCDGIARRAELDIALSIRGEGQASPAVEATIYRVLQEALINVLRHARAHSASVRLHKVRGTITLIVADDGIGLNNSHSNASIRVDARGVGLAGMRALVKQFDGRFIVREGLSGNGTLIAARIGAGEAAAADR